MRTCVRFGKTTILFESRRIRLCGYQAILMLFAPGHAGAFAGSNGQGLPEAVLGHGRSWQPIDIEPEVPASSADPTYWCSQSKGRSSYV